jgi:hypothetical protein
MCPLLEILQWTMQSHCHTWLPRGAKPSESVGVTRRPTG